MASRSQVARRTITRNTTTINRERIKEKKALGPPDFFLAILCVALTIFGVVMVFSASYYNSINETGTPYSYLLSQGRYAITGIIIMIVASNIDYHVWMRYSRLLGAFGLILLGLLFTPLGIEVGGATRWLSLGLFTIMPGEIAKAVIILTVSTYFARRMNRATSFMGLLPIVLYSLVVTGAIVKQPNLSTAITVFVIAVGIAFAAGLQWRYIVLMIGGAVAGTFYLVFVNEGYWHDRVMSFRDPFADSLGDGFQVVQSLLALGTGGLFGKGLGQSVQKNLYLPEPQNDFILAVIGEELGFVGIAILLIVFAVVVWRIFYISLRCKDNFGMLICVGVGVMIGIQVILNVAVVTSSMPPTGIALPFISAGGNALWIILGMIGIVLNISKTVDGEDEER